MVLVAAICPYTLSGGGWSLGDGWDDHIFQQKPHSLKSNPLKEKRAPIFSITQCHGEGLFTSFLLNNMKSWVDVFEFVKWTRERNYMKYHTRQAQKSIHACRIHARIGYLVHAHYESIYCMQIYNSRANITKGSLIR